MGDLLLLAFIVIVVAAVWASNNTKRLPSWLARLIGEPHVPELAPLTAEHAVEPTESAVRPPEPPRDFKPVESILGLPVRTSTSDEYGTTYTLVLPGAPSLSLTDLAVQAGVPERYVELRPLRDEPPNVVELWIGKPRKEEVKLAKLPDSTNWRDAFRLGEDMRGEEITAKTFNQNTLVGGIMRYGKSSVARHFTLRYLLDPTTTVIIVDGKGNKADWGSAPANEIILGTQDSALQDLDKVLSWVLNTIDKRNAEDGRQFDGILVMLDELQDLLAEAQTKFRDKLVVKLGRIMKKGPGVGVHVLIATQRPANEEIPTRIRSIMNQRLGLFAESRQAMDLILGKGRTGNSVMPTVPGEALYQDGGLPRFVKLDFVSDEEWERACAAAPKRDKLVLEVEKTLLDKIIDLMVDRDAEVMSVAEIAAAFGMSAVALGKDLGQLGYITKKPSASGPKSVWLNELEQLQAR